MDAQYERQLAWFTNEMVKKLDKNLYKDGWEVMSPYSLHKMLHKEMEELDSAIELLAIESGFGRNVDDEARKAIEECADMANYTMMVAERIGAIYLSLYDKEKI